MSEPRLGVITFELRRNLLDVLGAEHYPYAEFLYHELASNAYDEDATEVHLDEHLIESAAADSVYDIVVRDNGNGMDFDGLREYFTVGESGKPGRQVSEVHRRPLIGRLGVGKVAIL